MQVGHGFHQQAQDGGSASLAMASAHEKRGQFLDLRPGLLEIKLNVKKQSCSFEMCESRRLV